MSLWASLWGFAAGQVVFHGPKDDAMPFFNSLGFQLPERKGVADFLQEVTSEKDQKVCCSLLIDTSGNICAKPQKQQWKLWCLRHQIQQWTPFLRQIQVILSPYEKSWVHQAEAIFSTIRRSRYSHGLTYLARAAPLQWYLQPCTSFYKSTFLVWSLTPISRYDCFTKAWSIFEGWLEIWC